MNQWNALMSTRALVSLAPTIVCNWPYVPAETVEKAMNRLRAWLTRPAIDHSQEPPKILSFPELSLVRIRFLRSLRRAKARYGLNCRVRQNAFSSSLTTIATILHSAKRDLG